MTVATAAASGGKTGRPWLLVGALTLAALLHAATFLGVDQNAFILWNSIHAFYFKHSYAAGMLQPAIAVLLLAAAPPLLLRRPLWAQGPAFLAMIASFVLIPRLGALSPLAGYVHPIQLVPWSALALTWAGCLWLFALARRPASP